RADLPPAGVQARGELLGIDLVTGTSEGEKRNAARRRGYRHPVEVTGRRSVAVDAELGECLFQLVRLDQDVARLGPLGGADDAAGLHQVHETTGLGEADPELALPR